jgi:hypothetical protein
MVDPCRQGQELLADARVVADKPVQGGGHDAGAERSEHEVGLTVGLMT